MSVPKHNLPLPFPINGVDRSTAGYDIQDGYASDVLNVRPMDPTSRRLVGSKRPGTRKWSSTQLGGGKPVILMVAAQFSEKPDVGSTLIHTDSFDYPGP